uniref:Pecanex-like protein n=1 Tax=Echinostoma caproni TaxID=27848 RepID=A0A183A1Q2_9TREM
LYPVQPDGMTLDAISHHPRVNLRLLLAPWQDEIDELSHMSSSTNVPTDPVQPFGPIPDPGQSLHFGSFRPSDSCSTNNAHISVQSTALPDPVHRVVDLNTPMTIHQPNVACSSSVPNTTERLIQEPQIITEGQSVGNPSTAEHPNRSGAGQMTVEDARFRSPNTSRRSFFPTATPLSSGGPPGRGLPTKYGMSSKWLATGTSSPTAISLTTLGNSQRFKKSIRDLMVFLNFRNRELKFLIL